MFSLPDTQDRVHRHTSERAQRRIRERTRRNVARYANASPAAVAARIRELQGEWDVERMLEANAASLALIGLGLGLTVDRRYLALPVVVGGFLLQHALQGWCPPLPVFRRLGVRTAAEIQEEITALRLLRGDFEHTSDPDTAIEKAGVPLH